MKLKTAMLLAAGRGERLSPLTDHTPKPLLPFQGKPLIVHHLEHLKKLKIEKVIINVHYLAKKIIETLGDGKDFNLIIEYSYQEKLLGAGGAIRRAMDLGLIKEDPFLFISADIYTDFTFEKFFEDNWSLGKNLVHAVLTDKKPNQHGDFNLEKDRLALADHPDFIYGSIAVIHPKLFADEPKGYASLMPAFSKAIEQKKASGEYYANILNINTVEEYTHRACARWV